MNAREFEELADEVIKRNWMAHDDGFIRDYQDTFSCNQLGIIFGYNYNREPEARKDYVAIMCDGSVGALSIEDAEGNDVTPQISRHMLLLMWKENVLAYGAHKEWEVEK